MTYPSHLPFDDGNSDPLAPTYRAQPGYPAPHPGMPPVYGVPQPAYFVAPVPPVYGLYPGAADPLAPFGRDPLTGEPLSDKSKVASGLLQLFLGGFGVGRFYLGHGGVGAAQLCLTIVGWLLAIFFVGFILLFAVSIWALVDAVMMFTGSVRDSRGYKLRS